MAELMYILAGFALGNLCGVAIYHYVRTIREERNRKKQNEFMIRFINNIDAGYVSNSTWGVTERYSAQPIPSKEEVWDMCVDLYESKIIDSGKFRRVSKLLDKNKVKEAYQLLNS
jgi:hypothetical protein